MGSKPITQRAGTRYGSAPANQEVTVDARGTTPAKFARMSPVKQVTNTDPIEEDVRDENSNDLLRGSASFSLRPDQRIFNPGQTTYGWSGALDTSGNFYDRLAKEEGFRNFNGTIQQYEQFKLGQMSNAGNPNVTQQEGESTTTIIPGGSEVSFDYKPIIQNVDTEKLRESRQRNRITKGSGRRATADANRVINIQSRLEKLAKKAGTTTKDIKEEQKSDRYKKLENKLNNKKKVAEASQARFDQNVEFSKSGVNPYNTRRTEQSKKASEDTQTKSEFESKFGGNNLGIQEIKSFTPGSIDFSPTTRLPWPKRSDSNFTGAGSYLAQMAGNSLEFPDGAVSGNEGNLWNPKGMPKKGNVNRGYKMSGYGTKNK
jgi:hypothetical protein